MGTRTTDDSTGPFWVVLGGPIEETGIWQFQRPVGVAMGRFLPLVPIVVIVKSLEDADRVNDLNAEIFQHVDGDDYAALHHAISTSRTVRDLFTQHGKMYAFRWAQEPGIYVSFTWPEVEHYKSFSGAKYQGFETFCDAMLFMIDKEPQKRAARGPQAPPLRIQVGITVGAGAPATTGPRFPLGTAIGGSGSAAPTYGAARPASTYGAFETQPYATHAYSGGSASVGPSPVKLRGSSTTRPGAMRASASVKPEPIDDVEHLSQFMRMMFDSLPMETRALRSLVGPLACQDPAAASAPPLTFGQRADAFLRERELSPAQYLAVLQARLYSMHGRAFGYALHRELGWPKADGEQLWDYLELPLLQ
ncbi:hypothetical protein C8Q76DRAFT_796802 [Earliella scabrosa]|nr:hypothetical protein C8Q76DRAFT_796802 [Earliella scabrosa]